MTFPFAFTLLALATSIVPCDASAMNTERSEAHPCATETYRTRGVVKGFTADRKLVNVAHEKIDGYMMAMTMTFEPRTREQVASLKVGDRIQFTFTVTDDGHRLLDNVTVE